MFAENGVPPSRGAWQNELAVSVAKGNLRTLSWPGTPPLPRARRSSHLISCCAELSTHLLKKVVQFTIVAVFTHIVLGDGVVDHAD